MRRGRVRRKVAAGAVQAAKTALAFSPAVVMVEVMAALLKMACLATAALLGACGGPVLANAPRPNPAVVAGVAAATAAAITLANPDAAARNASEVEKNGQVERGPASTGPRETAPADVLDRLDEASAPRAEAPRPQPPPRPVRELVQIPWLMANPSPP